MIVIYDAQCIWCSRCVHWLIRKDYKQCFRYAPAHGITAQQFASEMGFNHILSQTLVVVDGKNIYTKANAVFKIAANLNLPYRMLSMGRFLPQKITNALYQWIAINRHLLGKRQCMKYDDKKATMFLP
jgi:predicted DCC family thiol-disulfide oxidoreductase YuxK